jgi:1,4-alpha-glucan branching enzyme
MAPPRPNPQKASEAATGRAKPPSPIQRVAERFPALEEADVTLTYLAPEAKQVNVAGKFNGWSPDATPMENTGAGEWTVRLELRSGQYEYRFVVDGQWCEDPLASQRVPNSHGEFDSVLVVPLAVRTSIL